MIHVLCFRSKRNRNKYYVQGIVNKELTRSFAELDLFREQGSFVTRFMKDLHDRPFETTLTAFSKLTGAVASGLHGTDHWNHDCDSALIVNFQGHCDSLLAVTT